MKTKLQQRVVVGLAAVVAVAGGACAGNGAKATTATTAAKTTGTPLKATVSDYKVEFESATAPAGNIRLTVSNTGAVEHELVAFKTDLDESQLPLAGGRVNEEGAGITHFDPEAENLKAAGSKTITLDLPAGRYVFICNLPGHYALGMHAVLTVQ
jgi:uncharacterized cupredoxin-like copper-binding protein